MSRREKPQETCEDVTGDRGARRMGWVDEPLAAEDHVIQRSWDPQEGGEGAVRPAIGAGL